MTIAEQRKKSFFAADIVANQIVEDVFVLTQAQQFQAKNGPFWRLTLQDASGQIDGKVWSPLAQEFSEFSINSFYEVSGRSSLYKDKVELSVSAIAPLGQELVDTLHLGDFIAVSPYSPEIMLNELKGLCEHYISHPPLVRFFDLLFGDDAFVAKFKKAPAAKAMHHAYAGGLLEHTLSICRLCMSIADNYPSIDRQILLAGAVCHDIGKIWELSSGVSIDYTDEGRLVGHISLGFEKITPYMERAGLEPEHIMHIQHLILSHHGSYEFGAARLPSTAEAFVLHFADNIDAKLQQVSQAFGDDPEGSGWSGFVRGLDRQVYRPAPLSGTSHSVSSRVSPNTSPSRSPSRPSGAFSDDVSGVVAFTVPQPIGAFKHEDNFSPPRSSLMKESGEGNEVAEADISFLPEGAQTPYHGSVDDGMAADAGDTEGIMGDFPEPEAAYHDVEHFESGYMDALTHDAEQLFQPGAVSDVSLWVSGQGDTPDFAPDAASDSIFATTPDLALPPAFDETLGAVSDVASEAIPEAIPEATHETNHETIHEMTPETPHESTSNATSDATRSAEAFTAVPLASATAPSVVVTFSVQESDSPVGESVSPHDAVASFDGETISSRKSSQNTPEILVDSQEYPVEADPKSGAGFDGNYALNKSEDGQDGAQDTSVAHDKKGKSASATKQSPLPLLEQCSLLLKE